jgi:hypothetical protein
MTTARRAAPAGRRYAPRAAGVPRNPIIPLPELPVQDPPAEEEQPEWLEEPEAPGVPGEPAGVPEPAEPAMPGAG